MSSNLPLKLMSNHQRSISDFVFVFCFRATVVARWHARDLTEHGLCMVLRVGLFSVRTSLSLVQYQFILTG